MLSSWKVLLKFRMMRMLCWHYTMHEQRKIAQSQVDRYERVLKTSPLIENARLAKHFANQKQMAPWERQLTGVAQGIKISKLYGIPNCAHLRLLVI